MQFLLETWLKASEQLAIPSHFNDSCQFRIWCNIDVLDLIVFALVLAIACVDASIAFDRRSWNELRCTSWKRQSFLWQYKGNVLDSPEPATKVLSPSNSKTAFNMKVTHHRCLNSSLWWLKHPSWLETPSHQNLFPWIHKLFLERCSTGTQFLGTEAWTVLVQIWRRDRKLNWSEFKQPLWRIPSLPFLVPLPSQCCHAPFQKISSMLVV